MSLVQLLEQFTHVADTKEMAEVCGAIRGVRSRVGRPIDWPDHGAQKEPDQEQRVCKLFAVARVLKFQLSGLLRCSRCGRTRWRSVMHSWYSLEWRGALGKHHRHVPELPAARAFTDDYLNVLAKSSEAIHQFALRNPSELTPHQL